MANHEVDLNKVCTCPRCKIFMPFAGIKYGRVSVISIEYDADGDPIYGDEWANAPYATWKCEKCGFTETDGY